MTRRFLAALFLAPLASPAFAAHYAIDLAHSSVAFKIRHLVTQVRGRFDDFTGTIDFDPAHPEKSSVRAEIKVASIDTRNAKRDAHLRSPDFFDADKYPVMVFRSTKVEPAAKGRYKVSGLLSLHGVEKPVVLDADFLGTQPSPDGAVAAGFSATAKIDRKVFGVGDTMLDKGVPVIGDDVVVELDVESYESK